MNNGYAPNPAYPPPKAGEPPLHRAARRGDHDAIRSLVAAGADINGVFDLRLDPDGHPMPATPLMLAAGSGDGASIETVEILLALGAAPRRVLRTRSAARFAAAGLGWNYRPGGDAQRLRRLLELGCDPAETDFRGATLLADTAWAGDAERARILLVAGASPNPAVPPGTADPATATGLWPFQIPLFSAAGRGDAEMTRLLLEAGADTAVTDRRSRNAIFTARGTETVLLLVAAGLDTGARDEYAWTPLDDAVADGDIERTAGLLAAGADVNASQDSGYTVFMRAVSSHARSIPMLQLLIAGGADPHAMTGRDSNAFHAAIDVNGGAANSEESVRSTFGFLHQLGVNINCRDLDGSTPLLRARAHGTSTEVRILRELGAR